jgi:HK97 family phage major capsid protein
VEQPKQVFERYKQLRAAVVAEDPDGTTTTAIARLDDDVQDELKRTPAPEGGGLELYGLDDKPSTELRVTNPGPAFRSVFKTHNIRNPGFSDFDEFASAILSGRADPRLEELRAGMSGNLGSSGGFACPTEWAQGLWDSMLPLEVFRPNAAVWPMSARTRKVPGWANFDNSGSSRFGGITPYWIGAEGDAITDSAPTLREIELNVNKCAALCYISNELLSDGMGVGEQLARALVETLSFEIDRVGFAGSGVGQPKGVLNDVALVTASKESGQTAATFSFSNAASMYSRLHPRCFRNARWYMSQTVIPSLLELGIPIGTAGEHVPALKDGKDGTFTLLGLPIHFTDVLPAVGTVGDVILADLTQYALGLRADIEIARSDSYRFNRDQVAFRVTMRADGQGTWPSAWTPANGDSLSWCVAVETRS